MITQGLYRSIHIEHLGISMVRGLAELAEKRDPTTGQHMERDRGRHFDPLVLDAFHDCIDDIRHIRELFDDPPVEKMASAGRS